MGKGVKVKEGILYMMVNEGLANRESCEPKLEMKKWSMQKRNSNPAGKDLNAKALGMKQLLGAFQPLHHSLN